MAVRTLVLGIATLGVDVAASATFTLADAERVALARDSTLERLAAESEALQARGIVAGELPDPEVRIGAANVPVDQFDLDAEDMTMLEIGISQRLPPGDSRRLSRRRYESEAAAVSARIADRRRRVVRELTEAWIEHARLSESARLVGAQIEVLEPLVANALSRYASGDLRQLDVVGATLEQTMLRERLLELRAEQAGANAALERWLGLEVDADATSIPPPREWPDPPVLEARLAAHPSQAEHERLIAAATLGEALARQRYRPEWMLDLSYGFRDGRGMDGAERPDMLSAMLRFNLPIFTADRQDRELAAARAETRSLHAMHLDHQRELRAELVAALAAMREARELEALYAERLIALGEGVARAARTAYANDTADFEEVIAAGKAVLELELGHVRAAAMRALAESRIAYLAGDAP